MAYPAPGTNKILLPFAWINKFSKTDPNNIFFKKNNTLFYLLIFLPYSIKISLG